MADGIDHLIINSAYEEPQYHWLHDDNGQTFHKEPGRREAGYFIVGQGSNQYNDAGQFIKLPLVNRIRPRVKAWREMGFPGVTGVTRDLLNHWENPEMRRYPFFFCQLDAIETLIWLAEAPASDRIGCDVPSDGGEFRRFCTKLCTGGGKTAVMAMLIAWMVCNKATYPQDKRFTKNVLVVAPGLTVKSRLQVLTIGGEDSYYEEFEVVPEGLKDKLYQGQVKILNWQSMAWESAEQIAKKKSVDKRGPKSDEAYTREILAEMANAHNIVVINDEAHHAWRKNPENKGKIELTGQDKKDFQNDEEEATVWINGLDRINTTRGILGCYDFSATPFAPSGKKNGEEALFEWIVSDFGLNDGVEAGLVKTPRVVVRDDGQVDTHTMKSKLYHIYIQPEVKDDITRAAEPAEPLPNLVTQAYMLLGKDWQHTSRSWQEQGFSVPPVMITVANRTETAARIKYAFDHDKIADVPELCDGEHTVQIDSKIIKADGKDGEALRELVDTVGKQGKPGEQIRNVISVGMLSEGWDAKTVTHIMGLRAFSSQLLCEQVIGRGLRRRSYDVDEETGMFTPEYVNIFGIPFTFLPAEDGDAGTKPTKPKTMITALPERNEYSINWPNILRFDREYKPKLTIDSDEVPQLTLDASDVRLSAELSPVVDGQTDLMKVTEINLEKLEQESQLNARIQTIAFQVTADVYELMQSGWKNENTKIAMLGQIFKMVEVFLQSDKIWIEPALFYTDEVRRRILLKLQMDKIVRHLWQYIKVEQTDHIVPVYAKKRVRSTADMQTWYTGKACWPTKKSQISHVVLDSGWENTSSYVLERNEHVTAYAKNDHLGFDIVYTYAGMVRKYIPDFLIKLDNGKMLVLEIKGQDSDQNRAKREALAEWCQAVNDLDEYGEWYADVAFNTAEVDGIIDKYL